MLKFLQALLFFCIRAPAGCVQYFTGTSGRFATYNHQEGRQLGLQAYSICFRQEEGMERPLWKVSKCCWTISHFPGFCSYLLRENVATGIPRAFGLLPLAAIDVAETDVSVVAHHIVGVQGVTKLILPQKFGTGFPTFFPPG